MKLHETLRAYLFEPIVAGFSLSVLLNVYGTAANSRFMHEEARDILSLLVVLLGAALALWIGLFWVSSTAFGQWLAKKKMLAALNNTYIASIIILLFACLSCVFDAHLSDQWRRTQLFGEFFCLSGLATVYTLLSNTLHLLRLHNLYLNLSSSIPELRKRN